MKYYPSFNFIAFDAKNQIQADSLGLATTTTIQRYGLTSTKKYIPDPGWETHRLDETLFRECLQNLKTAYNKPQATIDQVINLELSLCQHLVEDYRRIIQQSNDPVRQKFEELLKATK